MRVSLILLLCLCGLAVAHRAARADDDARARALALLRLAAPMPGIDPAPVPVPAKHDGECIADLATARTKATAESRPLLIWVGGCNTVDKAVRGAFPDAVHCHCDALNGSAEHRLLIPLREGAYAVFDSEKLTKADIANIRSVLERAPAKTASTFAPAPGDCQDGTCAVSQVAQSTRYSYQPVGGYQSFGSAVQCATGR